MKQAIAVIGAIFLAVMKSGIAQAADSYRYLHVSIDTPWHIFLFLLIGVLAPFVVMAWLYWRHARQSRNTGHKD